MNRNVPWKTASCNEKLIFQAAPSQQVGVCHKFRVGAGISFDILEECFKEIELTLELITLFC